MAIQKTAISAVIAVTLMSVALAGNYSQVYAQSEDEMLTSFESQKVNIEGEIIKVKMSESADPVPWEEIGIRTADGKIYILIGKAVENIAGSVGTQYLIKGMTKPSMIVSGEPVTVIELESAQILSNPASTAK